MLKISHIPVTNHWNQPFYLDDLEAAGEQLA
jgi:hypothetical protein